jgi:prepilin-type N-terminal cleavage/methylation domain-containing protein
MGRLSKQSRGYTAVEVLLAMTVLAIGAAGVMSMQTGAIQGNLDARKLDVANSIARDWLERLRRDATVWTLPGGPFPAVNNFPNATLISANAGAPTGAWFLPPIPGAYPAEGQSPAFDMLGRDLAATDLAIAVFCVNAKIDVVSYDQGGAIPELVRATVRVFWLKQLAWSAPPPVFCAPGVDPVAIESAPATQGTFHIAFASTVIRRNTVQ